MTDANLIARIQDHRAHVSVIADASFPTPTALGAWLRETALAKRVQARQLEEARLLSASKELLEQLFAHYEQLDEDLKAELPLKRIWTVAAQEDE